MRWMFTGENLTEPLKLKLRHFPLLFQQRKGHNNIRVSLSPSFSFQHTNTQTQNKNQRKLLKLKVILCVKYKNVQLYLKITGIYNCSMLDKRQNKLEIVKNDCFKQRIPIF